MTSLPAPELSTLLTLALYAFAGAAGLAGMAMANRTLRLVAASAAAAGFLLQTLILVLGFHAQTQGGLSVGAYLQLLAWFLALSGLALWLALRQEVPLLFAALLALLLYGLSTRSLDMVLPLPDSLSAPFYALHIGALYVSLALVALSAAAGLLFLLLEGRIKSRRRIPAAAAELPALNILDRINLLSTLAGFPLFTIGLVCGLFYARPVYGSVVTGDPKEVVSLLVWACFALLFYKRVAAGWRGRKPARLMLALFCLSLFSIVVVNIFMHSHHAFLRG